MALTSLLQQATPDDSVLHIGPGALYNQIDYGALRTRFVVVEPDLLIALELRKMLSGHQAAEVLNRAISYGSEERTYYEFNFPAMNNLRAPAGVERYFPGLELRATHKIDSLTIQQLTGKLPRKHHSCDILIIDALGEAMDLLAALEKANMLSRFNHVVVRAPVAACFQDSAPYKEIAEWLGARFYGEPFPICVDDPDFPTVCFTKDAAREELDKTLRMKLLADNDLRALQKEYAALSAQKEVQNGLFLQAVQRLSETSDFLGELSKTNSPDVIAQKLKSLMSESAPPEEPTSK